MRDENPVDLTVQLPTGSEPDASHVQQHLEDELRTRGEVLGADGREVRVRAYQREEVEAVADELVAKLNDLGMEGTTVRWTDDEGQTCVRPIEYPVQ